MQFSKTLLMAGILAAKSTQAVSLKQEAQGTDITPLQVYESMISILERLKNYVDTEDEKITRTLQAEIASLREQVEADQELITDYEA